MKGAQRLEHLFLKRPRGGSLEGGGGLEEVLKKAPGADIFFHRGPFTTAGNLEFGGRAHIPGTLKDE